MIQASTMDPGSRLGPYEILERIGAGGMGEVFRARDSRLDRVVAIKILPPEFASSPRSRARFEREAKLLSQISHPNICVIHDVGEQVDAAADPSAPPSTVRYLVMEYLEGESLAQRLQRGPMPVDQVLRIGAQIADALEKAHRGGVVHRDLKPANVMITRSGAKLLDFGLAKESGVRSNGSNPDTAAPTDPVSITEEGRMVGTFSYMAPEQLEGLDADARTDVFALGALLYEMMTGKRAFVGASKISLIAMIAAGQPAPMQQVQPLTPPALEHVVLRCLEKSPDDRWQSAHDIRVELDWISQAGSRAGFPVSRIFRRRLRERVSLGILVFLFLVGAVAVLTLVDRTVRDDGALTVELTPPAGERYLAAGNAGGPAVISPDGRRIVYRAEKNGVGSLWVRSIETGESKPVPNTDDAYFPFWAPDSRRIGYFSSGGLLRIDVDGGERTRIADARNGRGGTWSPDGTIVFAPDVQSPLVRVSESGGGTAPLTKVAPPFSTYRWPSFLPDGKHLLFFAANHRDLTLASNSIFIASLDDPSPRLLLANASNGVYVDGYLLYERDRILWAQPMSTTGDFSGTAKLVARDAMFDADVWRGGFSVSPHGRLTYFKGDVRIESELVWLDRSGAQKETFGTPAKYWEIAFSPDGTRAALSIGDPLRQIWLADLPRETRSRVMLDLPWSGGPIWNRDGSAIYLTAIDSGTSVIMRRSLVDGSQREVAKFPGVAWAAAVNADESQLVVTDETRGDLLKLHPGKQEDAVRFIADQQAIEHQAVGSPDGEWIAYCSNETGTFESYVARMSDASAKIQLSHGGGTQPAWRADGRELYFVDPQGLLHAMPVALNGDELVPGVPKPLFHVATGLGMSATRVFAPTGDGQRFLVVRPIETAAPVLRLVTNWKSALRDAER
ncbi:MAG: protein kinase [Thermoanaerobaculia bacterium]|jgi:serine/threonine protein kinase/Tol biopolymer transport system component